MAASVDRGKGVCGSVGAIAGSADRSNCSIADGNPKRRKLKDERVITCEAQESGSVFGQERYFCQEHNGCFANAGIGGDPEESCKTITHTKSNLISNNARSARQHKA